MGNANGKAKAKAKAKRRKRKRSNKVFAYKESPKCMLTQWIHFKSDDEYFHIIIWWILLVYGSLHILSITLSARRPSSVLSTLERFSFNWFYANNFIHLIALWEAVTDVFQRIRMITLKMLEKFVFSLSIALSLSPSFSLPLSNSLGKCLLITLPNRMPVDVRITMKQYIAY